MSSPLERHSESSDLESTKNEDDKCCPNNKSQFEFLRGKRLAELLQTVNFVKMLPGPVKRRVKALKQLQLECLNIESNFYQELHELESKYYKLSKPLFDKRSKIVSGEYEPNDQECVFESDEEEEGVSTDMQDKLKIEVEDAKAKTEEQEKNIRGIPEFWLTVFRNVRILGDNVQEHDEPILKHLKDITIVFHEKDPMAFVLEFHFSPNEYFSNSVLTKEYLMRSTPEKNDPFSFEGPEIYKAKGCKIDWKKGKNVTIKTVKKSQKHKSRGSTRTVTKVVEADSFFNFFNPPTIPDDADVEVDEEIQALLASDYEMGHYIRERLVPRAVLYFTGEALDDEDEDYDEEEEEEGDDDDMDDDDEDEEESDNDEKKVIKPEPRVDDKCQQQ